MKTALSIRRAHPPDGGPLRHVITDAYEKYRARIPDLPDVSGGLGESIERKLVWVAEEAGQIVGGLILVADGTKYHLENVAVANGHAGKGIGSQLMAKAESFAKSNGGRKIVLTTHSAMPENVALYSHLGWQVTGESGTKIHMEKQL